MGQDGECIGLTEPLVGRHFARRRLGIRKRTHLVIAGAVAVLFLKEVPDSTATQVGDQTQRTIVTLAWQHLVWRAEAGPIARPMKARQVLQIPKPKQILQPCDCDSGLQPEFVQSRPFHAVPSRRGLGRRARKSCLCAASASGDDAEAALPAAPAPASASDSAAASNTTTSDRSDPATFLTKYGPLAIGVHSVNVALTFGVAYALVSNGLPVAKYLPAGELSKGLGNTGIAFLLVQATKPFRLAFEFGAVPILAEKIDQVTGGRWFKGAEDADHKDEDGRDRARDETDSSDEDLASQADAEKEIIAEANVTTRPAKDGTPARAKDASEQRRQRYGLKYDNPPPWLVQMYNDYRNDTEAREKLEGTNLGRQLDDYDAWLAQGEQRIEPTSDKLTGGLADLAN